jgi:hypothetical protein
MHNQEKYFGSFRVVKVQWKLSGFPASFWEEALWGVGKRGKVASR